MANKDYETLMYLVLIAGFLFRVYFSFAKSIYHDEAMYLALGYFAGFNPLYFLYTADYTNFWGGTIFSSLLPLVVDRVFYSIFNTAFGLRLAKVIAGVCSIYIVYKICKKTANEKTALLASFFLALNSTNVFSDFLKYEAYETFFVLLGAFFLIEKSKNSRYYSAIAFFIAVLMKYSAVVPISIVLLGSYLIDKKLGRKIIPAGFLFIILTGTFLMWHVNQIEVLGRTSEVYKSMKESPFDTVGTTVTGFLIFFLILLTSFKKIKKDMNLVWLITGLVTIVYFNITMPNYVFFTQYLTTAVPFMAMGIAPLLEKMNKKVIYGIVFVFFVANTLNMFNVIDFPIKSFLLFATPDWRPAVQNINPYLSPGTR